MLVDWFITEIEQRETLARQSKIVCVHECLVVWLRTNGHKPDCRLNRVWPPGIARAVVVLTCDSLAHVTLHD